MILLADYSHCDCNLNLIINYYLCLHFVGQQQCQSAEMCNLCARLLLTAFINLVIIICHLRIYGFFEKFKNL